MDNILSYDTCNPCPFGGGPLFLRGRQCSFMGLFCVFCDMVINEHRCVQAQILVASIVNVGVGAQVRLSLLIFIFKLFQASQAIWWESLAVASSRKQLLAVNLNLAGSCWQQNSGGNSLVSPHPEQRSFPLHGFWKRNLNLGCLPWYLLST